MPSLLQEPLLKKTEQQVTHVVIVAAGKSERYAGDKPKQYLTLLDKPVLRHSIETFLKIPGVADVHIVISKDHIPLYDCATKDLDLPPPIYGGTERMESVKNALQALSHLGENDIILLHDAARPLITRSDIQSLLLTMQDHDAATLAIPVNDTLRYNNKHGYAAAYANREGLWAIQTPQAFHYGILKESYAKAPFDKTYTDETGPVSDLGKQVKLVKGHKNNFKITHQEDLAMAEKILSSQSPVETRTGQGFDVHGFDEESKYIKVIKLCGIEIPHNKKLKGHSDADVGLHALTDAILGAIGAGDIGQIFPPENPTFKNMDSAVFLEKARDLVKEKAGNIINVDITLICEEPKIGPHREKISVRIAEILDISSNRVNIKATTTEKLGFTGRKEGIAAQAIANISLPMKDIT